MVWPFFHGSLFSSIATSHLLLSEHWPDSILISSNKSARELWSELFGLTGAHRAHSAHRAQTAHIAQIDTVGPRFTGPRFTGTPIHREDNLPPN